ncbi:MAG: helix-turn-helix transcriptional regulator [Oscillospiraceae bacterium]|nr:helix-turn-helix transcriptional regulator [Oscillospiraceae bacterium]
MVDFGNTLKELRQKAGLTQKQLADKMGITASVVSYYELSERNPSPEVLVKLASIFHVTTDFLLGIQKKPNESLDVGGLDKDEVELLQHAITVFRNKKQL